LGLLSNSTTEAQYARAMSAFCLDGYTLVGLSVCGDELGVLPRVVVLLLHGQVEAGADEDCGDRHLVPRPLKRCRLLEPVDQFIANRRVM